MEENDVCLIFPFQGLTIGFETTVGSNLQMIGLAKMKSDNSFVGENTLLVKR
jgi:hypothetical protein